MKAFSIKQMRGGAVLVALALMLSACLLAPGRFDSTLDIRKDGQFSFSYTGDIHLLPLSNAAKGGASIGEDAVFEPEACSSNDGVERDCTPGELDRQMRHWQSQQENGEERRATESRQMAAMLGGFDPENPEAAEEFAANLRRQAGWKKVDYKGDGRFEVEFAISGTLDHDFVFPTMERFPMANAFVLLSLREDGTVRIDAPGYAPGAIAGSMQGFAQAAMIENEGKKGSAKMPELDGRFIVNTDGRILANNTEEGPGNIDGRQRLAWQVNMRSSSAPTALVQLER